MTKQEKDFYLQDITDCLNEYRTGCSSVYYVIEMLEAVRQDWERLTTTEEEEQEQ